MLQLPVWRGREGGAGVGCMMGRRQTKKPGSSRSQQARRLLKLPGGPGTCSMMLHLGRFLPIGVSPAEGCGVAGRCRYGTGVPSTYAHAPTNRPDAAGQAELHAALA